MTKENISWSVSTKMLPTWRGLNLQPPDHQSHPTEPLRQVQMRRLVTSCLIRIYSLPFCYGFLTETLICNNGCVQIQRWKSPFQKLRDESVKEWIYPPGKQHCKNCFCTLLKKGLLYKIICCLYQTNQYMQYQQKGKKRLFCFLSKTKWNRDIFMVLNDPQKAALYIGV